MDCFWRVSLATAFLLFANGCSRDTSTVSQSPSPVASEPRGGTNDSAVEHAAVVPELPPLPVAELPQKADKTVASTPAPVSSPPLAVPERLPNVASEATEKPAPELPSPILVAQVKKNTEPSSKKTHEPLFVDWPQPQFAIVVTGRQNGYIEPCGCTGLANQKGGMSRRHSLLQQLASKSWPLAVLDVGNQVKRFGRQSEIKLQIAVEGLKKMGYQAIGLGPDDLRLSTGELVAAISDQPSRFVSANAVVIDPDLTPKMQVITVAGRKVGVTAVLGDESRKKVSSDEIVITPADAALQKVVPQLKAQRCDLYVLLAHATLDESRKLAQQFPDFQLVVTAGGAEEPAFEPEIVAGTRTRLVQVGAKGMYVGVLGFFADTRQPFRFQRVPLDDRFPDSPEMLGLLAGYQDQLKATGLEGLGLKPVRHPSGLQFVGSQKCGECHSKAFAVWENSGHAHATESLVHPRDRSAIARHFDPECLSCHVTGWEPQKVFPFDSGYLGLKTTPLMHANGCENCHGPGSAHVAAENGEGNLAPAAVSKLRASMRLPLAQAENKCLECHDHDNSPDFHAKGAFEKYWKQIEHLGKD